MHVCVYTYAHKHTQVYIVYTFVYKVYTFVVYVYINNLYLCCTHKSPSRVYLCKT